MNVRPLHQDATLEEIRQYLLDLDAFLQQYVVGSFADAQSAEEGLAAVRQTLAAVRQTVDDHTEGLAAVRQTVDDHTKRKDNPHEVTAQQVGAYPAGSKVADSERLNGQPASYYTNIVARLGYTPVNRAGDTMTGALAVPSLVATVNIPSSSPPSEWPNGFCVGRVYNNGYPVNYGSVFSYKGTSQRSCVQVLVAWPGTDGGESALYIRAARDIGSDLFGPWRKVWAENNDGSGSGLDADLLDGQHGSYYASKAYVELLLSQQLPRGIIAMWSGSIESIPDGWALCDGRNGTPDLRDRFVVGAGREYAVGDTGGQKEVTLTIDQIPPHSHTYTYRSRERKKDNATADSAAWEGTSTASTSTVGGGKPHENRPPYYAVCFIMKL